MRADGARSRSPGAPPGRGTSRRRCGSSCARRRAAPPCCSPRRVAALVWVNVDASSYASLWGTRAVDPARRPRHRAGSARLGELGADDVLLLRRRARGAPRVRHGRAARAAARSRCRSSPASAGWPCRSRSTSRSTPARVGARLGGGDVDGHRVRARAARARRAALPDRLRAFMLTVVVVDDVVALVRDRASSTAGTSPAALADRRSRLLGVIVVVRAARSVGSLPGSCTSCSAARVGGALRVGRRSGRGRPRRWGC